MCHLGRKFSFVKLAAFYEWTHEHPMLRLNNSIIHNSLEVNTNNTSWKEPRMKSLNSHWSLTGSSAAVAKASKQADIDIIQLIRTLVNRNW